MFSLPYRGLIIVLLVIAFICLSNFVINFASNYGTFNRLSSNIRPKSDFKDVILSRSLLNSSLTYREKLSYSDDRKNNTENVRASKLPSIFMITPTYRRAEQIPELTRTCQTLMLVKNLVWIVIEDAIQTTPQVVAYLRKCGIPFVYMKVQMPTKFAKVKNKPRGVANRNAGIEYVRRHARQDGVIYFGDDDNTYDVQVFEEMRWTKGVSMFPVGLVTKYAVSSPIVRDGVVIDFYDGWVAKRTFPVDMAGFAVNVKLLRKYPTCVMPFVVGYEEDGFLKCLKITKSQIEPKAKNCTEILVWHTQTKKNPPAEFERVKIKLDRTNLAQLTKKLWTGS